MGSSLSDLQKQHCQDLIFLLNKHGHRNVKAEVQELIVHIDKFCPWYPEQGTFKIADWDKIGKTLQAHPSAPVSVLHTWCLCRSVVQKLVNPLLDSSILGAGCPLPQILPPISESKIAGNVQSTPNMSEDKMNKPPKPPDKALIYPDLKSLPDASAPVLSPPQYEQAAASSPPPPPPPPPTAPPSLYAVTTSPLQQTMTQKLIAADFGKGDDDFDAALPLLAAFPVVRNDQGHQEFQSVSFAVYKELRRSINENGLHSPYTIGLLDGLLGNNNFIPADWKAMIKAMLSPAQYVLFIQEWRDLAAQQAMENLNNNIGIGRDMLLGEGNFATIQQQIVSPALALQQIGKIIRQAWLKLPNAGQPTATFAGIRQGSKESYMDFVNRLQRAVERQIHNTQAAEILFKQLAFENANDDCKKALSAIHNKPETDIAQMLKACQNVGSQSYKADLLAAAFQTKTNPAAGRKCFSCGKLGHFKSQCRSMPSAQVRPSKKCPKCNKGYHWANQCHSAVQGNRASGPPRAQAKQ